MKFALLTPAVGLPWAPRTGGRTEGWLQKNPEFSRGCVTAAVCPASVGFVDVSDFVSQEASLPGELYFV